MDMIKKHYKRQLITLKRKRLVSTAIITTTLTKSKQLHFIGYKELDQKSKKQYKSLVLE